jgi:hypothetical protein
MPTTSNFGWTTPADTDLVKDGASAIRTLGNGIDTSLLDLKGGTTDQVLAKNSNTDLDFKWVTSDDANAIQNAIVDAKGDLISATAADTPARLAVGANDTVLTADSSTATGLKWAAPAGGGKVLQVVSMTKNTNFASTATTFTDVTGYSLSITPSATSSKVLAIFNPNIYGGGLFDNQYLDAQIVRGSTAVYVAIATRAYGGGTTGGYSWNHANLSLVYLDSPSTTSSTTYKMQLKASSAQDHGLNVTTGAGTGISSITLLEIGA